MRALGSPKRARDVVQALLWEGLERRGFPRRVEDEAREAPAEAADVDPTRRDLRDLATFTVDPATARDFDDAVSAQPDGDGVRLWIHIADVSAHVRPGSALDSEAYRRATSVYVPGMVEPMLPGALSNEACSLVPDQDRLAVTAEVRIDGAGKLRSASFYRSHIRSGARLDYDQLDRIFAGREQPPELVAEPLELARKAAAALAEGRPRGALEVESFEPEFEFDSDGAVVGAHSVPQTEAHQLIEHLMILANEQVADLLEKRKAPVALPRPRAARPGARRPLAGPARGDRGARSRLEEGHEPDRGGRPGRRDQPLGRARGAPPRPGRAVARLARPPLAQAGVLHRQEPRPRRASAARLTRTSLRRSAATRT